MKKILLIGLSLVFFSTANLSAQELTPWTGEIATEFGGGSGTQADPYLISNPEQLAKLSKDLYDKKTQYQGKYFQLTSDLDLGGKNGQKWTSIGIQYNYAFQGNFDGNGKHIYNMYIFDTVRKAKALGLFGRAEGNAVIKNIFIEDAEVWGNGSLGLIVGEVNSETTLVENCVVVSGEIKGRYDNCGGVVGYNRGNVRACINNAHIDASVFIGGGVVGNGNTGTIQECFNMGTVENIGYPSYTGGVVGYGKPVNCYNTGTVIAKSNAGGVVGDGSAQDCYNAGLVIGLNGTGSVMGVNREDGKNLYFDRQVTSGLLLGATYSVGSKHAFSTEELTSAQNADFIMEDSEKWVLNAGHYPQLKCFASSDNKKIQELSELSAIPLKATKNDSWIALTEGFEFANQMTLENKVLTLTSESGLFKINGTKATFTQPEKDTLVWLKLATDNYEKNIGVEWKRMYADLQVPQVESTMLGKRYIINTFENLAWVNAVNNGILLPLDQETAPNTIDFKNCELFINEDIDFKNMTWIPIAGRNAGARFFSAKVKGNNHVFKNVQIHTQRTRYTGFVATMNNGSIVDLTIESGEISATDSYTGAFAGMMVGGFLRNCVNKCNINGAHVVGGLVGSTVETQISRCVNMGNLYVDLMMAGGLVGVLGSSDQTYGLLEESYNMGDVYASEGFVGGLAYNVGTYASIENCFNKGRVSSEKAPIGGITSNISVDGHVNNCYNIGEVVRPEGFIGKINVGEIAGQSSGYLKNNYYDKDLSSFDGGIAQNNVKGQAEGLSTAEMKSEDFIKTLKGRANTTPWVMDEQNLNEGYPVFAWMNGETSSEDLQGNVTESHIRIYPNPATDYVTIEAEGLQRVSVYNVARQLCIRKEMGTSTPLELNALKPGIYLLVLELENDQVVRKLVKR